MSNIKSIFNEDLKFQMLRALIASSFIPTILIVLSCKIFNILITHFTWNLYFLLGEIIGCLQLYLLVEILLPILCNILLLVIHSKSYSLKWWFPEKRINYFKRVLHFRTILNILLITITCTILFHHYASLANGDVFSSVKACHISNLMCINHKFFVTMVFSFIYALKISMDYVVGNLNFLNPPVVSVNTLMKVKTNIHLKNIYYSNYFPKIGLCFIIGSLVCYVVIGSMVSNWSAALLGAHNQNSEAFLVLLNFPLFATLAMSMIAVGFHLHCFFSIFNDYFTVPIDIPLSEFEPDSSYLTDELSYNLKNGLISKNELLQHLSLIRLRDMARDKSDFGVVSRKTLFSISQPGGHPYYWQGIITPTLSIIKDFCDNLKKVQVVKNNNYVEPCFKRLSPPTEFDPLSAIMKGLSCLKRYPVFYFWLSSFPESKTRQLFAESQPVIYAIEGLAHLVAASYKEDKYGVVQKDITAIVAAIIEVQMLVDKTGRGHSERKPPGYFCWQNPSTPQDVILKKSLKATVRSSLYAIAISFGGSLKELQVPAEFRSKISSYLDFHEP